MFMESTKQFQRSHLGDPLDFTHHSDPHSQYPPPFKQPHKPSLEDTLQMFIQSNMQFQQATQTSLQANTKAIEKLEMHMGQLATLICDDEEEEALGQSIANLKGPFETEASSHFEQAETTTLRYDKVVDGHVGEPEVVNVQKDEDVTQSNIENIFISLEPSTSALIRYESILAYILENLFGLMQTILFPNRTGQSQRERFSRYICRN